MKFRHLSIALATFSLLISQPVFAQTAIKIDSDTKAFRDRQLQVGETRVSVTYQPLKPGQSDEPNLLYQIFHNNQLVFNGSDSTTFVGEVSLQNLNGDRNPEVIVSTFTGGAHCCTLHKIFSWQNGRLIKANTGLRDGVGGSFHDINGDGKVEFLTYDNSFLYAFSSYAGSFPPSSIYAFQNGRLVDVTRQYPRELRATLQEMFKAFQASKKEQGEVNGVLAGYVAQKILLGEYEQGWQFMLANYDRTSDWGLNIYKGEKQVGKYPDFPTALKAMLIRSKYLDPKGNPI